MFNKTLFAKEMYMNQHIESETELSAISRRGRILEILHEKEQVTVKEMAQKFGVSEMTIRRDFHGMEEQGLVMIHYGGATLRNTRPGFPSFNIRQEKLYQKKLKIAKAAVALIKEGDIIFLDTSTTILLMLRFLPDLHITVITNSLPVAQQLCNHSKIFLYLTPGMYQEQYGGPLDYSTAEYMSRFHYDKSFFGASAIDASFGASATREIESAVKRCVWKNSSECYLLADHTKFGKRNLIRYNTVGEYRCILTDDEIEPSIFEDINKQGGCIRICN